MSPQLSGLVWAAGILWAISELKHNGGPVLPSKTSESSQVAQKRAAQGGELAREGAYIDVRDRLRERSQRSLGDVFQHPVGIRENLRWARAGLSLVIALETFVSFRPEQRAMVNSLTTMLPGLYALSLRLKAPAWWNRQAALLRTFIYSIGLFSLCCVLVPHEFQKVSDPMEVLQQTAAMVFTLGLALALLLPCFWAFIKEGATPEPLDSPSRLIQTGWYAHLKHPILYGELLCVLAGVLAWPSTGGLLYAIALTVLLRGIWAPFEEKFLFPKAKLQEAAI